MRSLIEQACAHDNNYSQLEDEFLRATSTHLVRDPLVSACQPPMPLALSASVVIPAWNASHTLRPCITAIQNSSFNQCYPDKLEVVVVDDGSTDGTWELLESLTPGVRLKAARQAHFSRAHAQNTGIALAEGDVVISCDADMVLSVFAIEELVKRHQVVDDVMLLGFRGDVSALDPRIDASRLVETLRDLLPPYDRDVRVSYGSGAWPESMCRDSEHLKRLGGGKQIVMSDGARWDLWGLVYGALFSLRRTAFGLMDGYDEKFVGWGCEDTLVGVRAAAMGTYLLPVYSAAGWHIAHADRSPRKWEEFGANRRVFNALVNQPFSPGEGRYLSTARDRVQQQFERAPAAGQATTDLDMARARLTDDWLDPDRRGKHLHRLGRFTEAAAAFAEVTGSDEAEAWAVFDRGKALRGAGVSDAATELLREAAARLPDSAWPCVELGLAHAGRGDFSGAREAITTAAAREADNPVVLYITRNRGARHVERGAFYARQGDFNLARRDYEAALIVNPTDIPALLGRVATLIAMDQPGPAKLTLDRVNRILPGLPAVTEQRAALARLVERRNPLPFARAIAEQTQSIPGWFGSDEAELLIALTLRAACAASAEPPVIVEIGSYCGRATVAMALALHGICRPARIIAVAEPSLGQAPDGRDPADVLRAELDRLGLRSMSVCAPEEDPEPWRHSSRLLLVDGRHDLAGISDDLNRFLPSLAATGLVVFHDYASYFPDVIHVVDELLLDPRFTFVAQVGTLIALSRTQAQPA